ncbi:ABC transporter permease [Actinomadura sp. HBU206391]|uniref:ABC transporter permease n=1 Tax=Actinomadura sp. HBU206391 TaxID=2731692 RepID=UPI00164F45C2|nr:ABC transporter permease [Actinomadura sp. HBU206391]MBC6461939.1 ABC transporter permease [Actinomadura sp. HBU206391]
MTLLSSVRQLAGAHRPLLAVLALLVFVPSLLVTAVPATLSDGYDRALREAIADVPAAGQEIALSGTLTGTHPAEGPATDAALREASRQWTGIMPGRLSAVTGPVGYDVRTRNLGLGDPSGRTPLPDTKIALAWDPQVPERIRYVSGTAPRNDTRPTATGRASAIEVALAAKAAARLRLRPGDTVSLEGREVRISGLYEPVSAADPFWATRPQLLAALDIEVGIGSLTTMTTAALDAPGYAVLYRDDHVALSYTWRFPIVTGRVTAAGAQELNQVLPEFEFAVRNRQLAGVRFDLATRLGTVLQGFSDQLRVTQAVLAVAFAGLGAVAVGALALGCRVLLERMRPAMATMRARGGSLMQLSGLVAATVALVAVPAALAGYLLAALLVGGPPVTVALPGVLAVLATALLTPAALTVAGHRRPMRERRSDVTAPKASPRRLVLEALVITLSAAGIVVLRRRGLITESAERGTDPFIAAVPILLAAAAGLLMSRCYPYPLRAIGAIARRGRSTVPFVGLAQASRQGLTAVLPMIVLLLVAAVTGFAATIDVSVSRAQESSAWQAIGADAQVTTSALDPAALGRLRGLGGVEDAVAARFADSARLGAGGPAPETITVVAVDLDAYRRIVAGRPLRVPPAPRGRGAETPALFSAGLAARADGTGPMSLSWPDGTTLRIRRAATIKGFPTLPADQSFVVLPYAALDQVDRLSTTVFVRGHDLDAAQLCGAVLPGAPEDTACADTYARAHGELTGAPLVGMVRGAFRYTALVVGGYGTLTVLLALIIGASARGRTVSYLRTLGLSRRQARRLTMVELGPAICVAAVMGWVLGLLLPRVVGPAIDLRAFTGGRPAADYTLDLNSTALLAGGLIVFAGLAIVLDAALNSRLRLNSVMRMGDQP